MPARVFIQVLSAVNLPVMDRVHGLCDPYVEVRMATASYRTSIQRKTLNPCWNEEIQFEISDDCVLQDERIQFKIWDYDILSSDDVIGIVYVDVNPLLAGTCSQISGWFPIYDTLRGICGELNVKVTIEHLMDFNQMDESSAGIRLLSIYQPPEGYGITKICGFVEELVVGDDPEYDWVDSFRTARASNDQRLMLFYKMIGKMRRVIGRKASEQGGNTVLGFRLEFDLEGDSCVARGCGTACVLERVGDIDEPIQSGEVNLYSRSPLTRLTRREVAIDSEEEAVVPELQPLPQSIVRSKSMGIRRNHLMDVALITLKTFPPGAIYRLGGTVSARSVKLLGSQSNVDKVEQSRDGWWAELREEIRSHARSLSCTDVIGYSETTTIEEDLIVLSAQGTGAVLMPNMFTDPDTREVVKDATGAGVTTTRIHKRHHHHPNRKACSVFHIPYDHRRPPFSMKLVACVSCGSRYVPPFLLSTIDMPSEVPVVGTGKFLQTHVVRSKPDQKGAANAMQVSEKILFLDHDLHKQILINLKLAGHNAVFGLKIEMIVGETHIVAIATGTSCRIGCMSDGASGTTKIPRRMSRRRRKKDDIVLRDGSPRTQELLVPFPATTPLAIEQLPPGGGDSVSVVTEMTSEISLSPFVPAASETESLLPQDAGSSSSSTTSESDSTDSDEEDQFVVEVADDEESVASVSKMSIDPPDGYFIFATETTVSDEPPPLENIAHLLLLRRINLAGRDGPMKDSNKYVAEILKSMFADLMFKIRGNNPCYLLNTRITLTLPAPFLLQIQISTQACVEKEKSRTPSPFSDRDLAALSQTMDSDSPTGGGGPVKLSTSPGRGLKEIASHLPQTSLIPLFSSRNLVVLTPMPFVCGMTTRSWIGRIDLALIKEIWTVKEEGDIETWTRKILHEAQSLARSHAAAMGGDAVLNYRLAVCNVNHNIAKAQVYSVIILTGDVVQLYRESDSVPNTRPASSRRL